MQDRTMAVLTPMWQRIARGEVDLEAYSDEEILSGEIRMADGRLLPAPPVYPDAFIKEQTRRGMRKAERQIRKGAVESFEVQMDIMNDDLAPASARLKAAEMFQNRFLGAAPQHLTVTHEGDTDPRTALIEKLLSAKAGLPEVVDGEVVEDTLEELL